jgi:hypothetical protein
VSTPDITGGVRAVFNYVQHGEQRANVLHGIKSTDWTQTELVDLADNLVDAWVANVRPWAVDDLQLENVTVTSLEGPASEQYVRNCLSNCNGANGGAPAPGNATSTISWRTSGIGRSKRGRSFFPGFAESHINDDDTVNSGQLVSLSALGSAIMTAFLQSASSQLGVYSRVLNLITPVTSYVIENILDTQRRRLPQRGR